MDSLRGPGQRAGLSRAAVLTAGRELLLQGGVEALSMRALAARLGVRPNTLYSHVRSKNELLDELLDEALAAVHADPVDVEDPLAAVHRVMTSSYDVLLAQAGLVPLYLARRGARGPNARHLGEVTLTLLEQAGVTGQAAREALHVLIVYTIGAAAFAAGSPLTEPPPPASDQDHRAGFDRGLRWILAGIRS